MSRSRHSRAPLRRSSTPERILSAGLATATCVGVVGLLGARTIEANTTDDATIDDTAAVSSQPAQAPAVEPTTASGLTQADLDTYAAALATEKDRLDAYRAKLAKAARKLAREVQQFNAAQRSSTTASRPTQVSSVPSQPQASTPSKPKAAKPAASAKQPAAAPAPKAQPAPAPQPAPKPQSNTKGS